MFIKLLYLESNGWETQLEFLLYPQQQLLSLPWESYDFTVAQMITVSLILMTFSSTGRCENSFCEYSIQLCQYFFLCGARQAMVTYNPLTVPNYSETFLQ